MYEKVTHCGCVVEDDESAKVGSGILGTVGVSKVCGTSSSESWICSHVALFLFRNNKLPLTLSRI